MRASVTPFKVLQQGRVGALRRPDIAARCPYPKNSKAPLFGFGPAYRGS